MSVYFLRCSVLHLIDVNFIGPVNEMNYNCAHCVSTSSSLPSSVVSRLFILDFVLSADVAIKQDLTYRQFSMYVVK